ncbi:hypothetical protein BABINDRAFT_172319 [Babjeviella inositovora NRRL Y-12698]|uniref:Pumilio homology domain family member 3 n=1 Tax=Babjeviella inositovora NRRL Y-12698 TaxID=984486 RepID=A0A1E3QNP5_9ASCO|nr:uncharacterized protein BABINDRAFT_172319 [Babjeviella inositovora NRRL Y-12698]ODQ78607.1 hypothetical protein BABINDRAFT_172319 [Babjeviella inositovora NRRL Y-12698]
MVVPSGKLEGRRFSSYSQNDEDDIFTRSPFGVKRGTLSAISAPLGTAYNPPNNGFLGFATASISAGVPNHHMPVAPGSIGSAGTKVGAKSSFLERFANVSEATKEVELLNSMGTLSIGSGGRAKPIRDSDNKQFLASPNSSSIYLNASGELPEMHSPVSDSLNMNYTGVRHQSISEKIDSYSEHNSVSMDMNSQEEAKNIWNPANATSFFPSFEPQQVFPQMYPPYPFMNQLFGPDPQPFMPGGDPQPFMSGGDPQLQYGMFQPQFMYGGPQPPASPPKKEEFVAPSTGKRGRRRQEKEKEKAGPSNIYRSPLLEEIRNCDSPLDKFSLKDIYGHGIEFSKDQHGSRFIQQLLSAASTSAEDKEVIFNEIREIAYELMTDVFGNYVIQKYFEFGDDLQKSVLLSIMWGNFIALSLQMYGCRVVQKAIEFVDANNQYRIMEEFKDRVIQLIKDQNGNHVIQKSIEAVRPFHKVSFILASVKGQIYHLSTHPYGCRVIQRLLEFSGPEDQEAILAELHKFTFYLIQDQYGNYVIQHILEKGDEQRRQEIFLVVNSAVVNLSKHKFASNVVEKCIVYGDAQQRSAILVEVLRNNNDITNTDIIEPNSALALMMKDQFANYVVQKLVEVTRGDKKKLLIAKIKLYLKQISKSSFGKHLASIEKLILLAETTVVSDED